MGHSRVAHGINVTTSPSKLGLGSYVSFDYLTYHKEELRRKDKVAKHYCIAVKHNVYLIETIGKTKIFILVLSLVFLLCNH